jgi:hypothetical protein
LEEQKKKKKPNVATLFKGPILFFIVSLSCFLFFPNLFPLFKGEWLFNLVIFLWKLFFELKLIKKKKIILIE